MMIICTELYYQCCTFISR